MHKPSQTTSELSYNLLSCPAPSKWLAPTSLKSYKMFFQMFTLLRLKSNIIYTGLNLLPVTTGYHQSDNGQSELEQWLSICERSWCWVGVRGTPRILTTNCCKCDKKRSILNCNNNSNSIISTVAYFLTDDHISDISPLKSVFYGDNARQFR